MNVAFPRIDDELPPHRALSVADIRRMVDAGVLTEDEKVELIDGELVVMASKGYAHELIRHALTELLVDARPKELRVLAEPTLQLSPKVIVEPDIIVFPRSGFEQSEEKFVRPPHGSILLAIEIAVSSPRYDKLIKAPLYARHGVREYWVIDANERITWVHAEPAQNGWGSVAEHKPDEILTTPALPGFAVRLDDIGRLPPTPPPPARGRAGG